MTAFFIRGTIIVRKLFVLCVILGLPSTPSSKRRYQEASSVPHDHLYCSSTEDESRRLPLRKESDIQVEDGVASCWS